MQIACANTEILVPSAFEWWTFLALVTDPLNRFADLSFVSALSPAAGGAILDLGCLRQSMHMLQNKAFVILILWDGYQSYRAERALIDQASLLVEQLELRIVGDISRFEDCPRLQHRYLFAQHGGAYTPTAVSQGLRQVSFARPFAKLALRYRSQLISCKVLLQLVAKRRWKEYRQSRFVYCGHSGLAVLANHSALYGIQRDEIPESFTSELAEPEFVMRWLSALRSDSGCWANQIVMRGLLRFLALRILTKRRSADIFLNIYPEPNVNAYQASMLFRNHIFLDFGGTHGDEAIYPRSADLLLLDRNTIRFDLKTTASELSQLRPDDRAAIADFIVRYQESIDLQLDNLLLAAPDQA
jgi:hypothetical protein